MDEVVVEREAMDAEHPTGGRVDPRDVVARIDHHDPEPKIEQQRLRRLRRIDGRLDVAAGRADRRLEGSLRLALRSSRLLA